MHPRLLTPQLPLCTFHPPACWIGCFQIARKLWRSSGWGSTVNFSAIPWAATTTSSKEIDPSTLEAPPEGRNQSRPLRAPAEVALLGRRPGDLRFPCGSFTRNCSWKTCERYDLGRTGTVSTVTSVNPLRRFGPGGPFTAVPEGNGAASVPCIDWLLDVGCPQGRV